MHAQEWLSDRKRAEGAGIRVGDFELHPGVGTEVGYLSNVFNADKHPVSSGALRIAPHLFLSTLGGERATEGDTQAAHPGMAAFRGGLSGSFMEYFAPNLPGSVGANLNLDLTLNPQRPVSFGLIETFDRTNPHSNISVTGPLKSSAAVPNFARNQETLGARLILQTPGGLWKNDLGYRFLWDFFDSDQFKGNNNQVHTVDLNSSWEFLPKTAIFSRTDFAYQNYLNESVFAPGSTAAIPRYTSVSDNYRASTRLGLNGAVTSRIAGTAAVGYAADYFKTGNNAESLVVNSEVRYVPADGTEWAVGYDRTLTPSFQGNFIKTDRLFTRARAMFGGSTLVSLRAGVEFLHYGADINQGGAHRFDRRYFVEASGEYRFVSWLAGTLQGGLMVDDTAFVFKAPTGPGGVV
ncbi:MAG TPA: hypothetical protein VF331_28580, partial [Polyangiales bacterium]